MKTLETRSRIEFANIGETTSETRYIPDTAPIDVTVIQSHISPGYSEELAPGFVY